MQDNVHLKHAYIQTVAKHIHLAGTLNGINTELSCTLTTVDTCAAFTRC